MEYDWSDGHKTFKGPKIFKCPAQAADELRTR